MGLPRPITNATKATATAFLLLAPLPSAHAAGFTRLTTTGGGETALATNISRRNFVNNDKSSAAAASPLFRSPLVISSSGAHESDERRSGERNRAPVHSHTTAVGIAVAKRSQPQGQPRRRSRFKSVFGVTCNAAIAAFFAARLIGQELLLPSSMISSPMGAIPVPAAAVMRVAPAGATSACLERSTDSRSTLPALAGSSAAVAGTLLGRSYLTHRRKRREDGKRTYPTEGEQKANIGTHQGIISSDTCTDNRIDGYGVVKSTKAVSSMPMTYSTAATYMYSLEGKHHMTQKTAESKNPNQDAFNAQESIDQGCIDYEKKSQALSTDNFKVSSCDSPLLHTESSEPVAAPKEITLAKKVLHDCDEARRDFGTMKSFLEKRLEIEAEERKSQNSSLVSGEATPITALKLIQDREKAKSDYLKMKSLLEARLSLEAAERERIKNKANISSEEEKFQRRLLTARLRQDRIDRLLREERMQREQEAKENEAKRLAQELKRPSTITPELMSAVRIMQGDGKPPVSSQPEAGNEIMERKGRLRLVLASAASLVASISASTKAEREV